MTASAPASAAFAEALPLRREHASDWADPGIGLANAFVVVAIVAGFAFWLLRRRAAGGRSIGLPGFARVRGGAGEGLKVVQSTRLTAHATAHVLDWAGGQWLVVCTDASATVVSRRPPDDAPAPGAEDAR